MWTPTTRRQHSRARLRYGSDVTDAEWVILSPFLPPARPCGCPRTWEMREVVNAIFNILRGGVAWSLLPKDFPPWPTTYRWFARLRDDGTWERINHHLVIPDCERAGREASPTAAVIHSQSVKTIQREVSAAMTPVRGSKGASAALWWTPTAERSNCKPIAQPSRTARGPDRCYEPRD